MENKMYEFWLSNLPKIGPRKIEYLLNLFGEPGIIFHSSQKILERALLEGNVKSSLLGPKEVDIILANRDLDRIQREYTKMLDMGIYFVSKEDVEYPSKLKEVYDAPYGLYVKGKLPREEKKVLAVVGARECSSYGREMAQYLSSELGRHGIDTISGLARGIDTYAHWGTLQGGGITYGVLGCGVDICYPRENIELYMNIQEQGGIISEFPLGTNPFASNFPMRNRIISGMSDGILVIEAKEKSGSLITVDLALEAGKDIYALPGRATDRNSEGCNNLIRMGAKLITKPDDILEDLIPGYQKGQMEVKKIKNYLLERESKIVYSCVSLEPKHLEEILEETKMPIDTLMEQLLFLELNGFIKQTRTNYYKVT